MTTYSLQESRSIGVNVVSHDTVSSSIYKKVDIYDFNKNKITTSWFTGISTIINVESVGEFGVVLLLPSGKQFDEIVTINEEVSYYNVTFDLSSESPHEFMEWAYLSNPGLIKPLKQINISRPSLSMNLYRKKRNASVFERDIIFNQEFNDAIGGCVFEIIVNEELAFLELIAEGQTPRIVNLPTSSTVKCLVKISSGPFASIYPFQVIVSTQRYEVEPLLAFMTNGAIRDAKSLFLSGQFAEYLLYDKIADPSSAAIGGYFLLKTNQLDRMHNWPQNLANWFGWVPDGCIIYASTLLKNKQYINPYSLKYPYVYEIAFWLIESINRGLPIYTEGLRLLQDGLLLVQSAVGNDKILKNRIGKALAIIAPVISETDWASPTVTFNQTFVTIDVPIQFESDLFPSFERFSSLKFESNVYKERFQTVQSTNNNQFLHQ